ncbi:polysaccharide biosynthesis protein [Desulfosoma sp.]
MWRQLKNRNLYCMILADAVCFVLALYGAYALRFEGDLGSQWAQMRELLLWYVPAKLVVFSLFGQYRGMWRYTGAEDMWRLAQAVAVAFLVACGVLAYKQQFRGVSRAVLILDAVLTFVLSGALRVGIRSWFAAYEGKQGLAAFSLPFCFLTTPPSKSVLIVGAGGSGEKMLREIFDNPSLQYRVVGFLDDDPVKIGRTIRGVPVLGRIDEVGDVVEKYPVDQIFIATPSATGSQMRRIVDCCKATGIPFKTLPAIGAIMDGKVSVKSLRDVDYQDLLRREPVRLDTAGIRGYVSGKTVLVTGAGGSIGSELCRQLVRFEPERLVLVDAGEANLYGIQMELHYEQGFRAYTAVLAQVQNRPLMEELFATYRPQVVFHAAAYKHVPMLERNPWEAVFNNVLGSQITMDLAAQWGVERFVLVSTDKAVRPTNVMGASKRTAELYMESMPSGPTRFMAVRFGNVIGSSGSVVPLFRKQIEQGGPVTVTRPEVTRYFMTIPEAAQLILQAGALGKGGEIFVLDMGTPVKIVDMARDLIRLSGKRPDVDIEIVFTGLREGEKLYEELITQGEDVVRTVHEKILVLRAGNGHDPDSARAVRERLERQLAELYQVAERHQAQAIRCALQAIVPEYTPQSCRDVLLQAALPHPAPAV